MSPLVEEALKHLTANCNISVLHIFDEDQVKLTLKALHKHGEILDSDAIEAWVLAHHWKANPAKSIAAWARTIASNGQVRLKYRAYFSNEQEIIRQLQAGLAATPTQRQMASPA